MDIQPFHKKWVSLRNQINSNQLTLNKLRSLEDRLLLMSNEENREIADELYECIATKREELLKKEMEKNSPDNICNQLKIRMLCEDVEPGAWEGRFDYIKRKAAGQRGLLKQFEKLEFIEAEPLAHEFDEKAIESTFSSRMACIARMVRSQNSMAPYWENLSPVQQRAIVCLSGERPSPEGLSNAVDAYVANLRKQMRAAEAFYFGRVKEGKEILSKLSQEVQKRVDELVWQASGGSATPETMVAAILHSVEEQMGMHEAS